MPLRIDGSYDPTRNEDDYGWDAGAFSNLVNQNNSPWGDFGGFGSYADMAAYNDANGLLGSSMGNAGGSQDALDSFTPTNAPVGDGALSSARTFENWRSDHPALNGAVNGFFGGPVTNAVGGLLNLYNSATSPHGAQFDSDYLNGLNTPDAIGRQLYPAGGDNPFFDPNGQFGQDFAALNPGSQFTPPSDPIDEVTVSAQRPGSGFMGSDPAMDEVTIQGIKDPPTYDPPNYVDPPPFGANPPAAQPAQSPYEPPPYEPPPPLGGTAGPAPAGPTPPPFTFNPAANPIQQQQAGWFGQMAGNAAGLDPAGWLGGAATQPDFKALWKQLRGTPR